MFLASLSQVGSLHSQMRSPSRWGVSKIVIISFKSVLALPENWISLRMCLVQVWLYLEKSLLHCEGLDTDTVSVVWSADDMIFVVRNFEEKETTEMNNRFVLSAAGISAAAIGVSATADIVNVKFNMDKYPGEAAWTILDGSSVIAAEAAWGGVGSSDSRYLSSSYGYYNGSDAASGVWTGVNMDLSAGVYTVVMTDTYGDGWNDVQWGGPNDGTLAFSGPYGSNIAFTSGIEVTGTFEVVAVPAPGAVALLALAGFAGVGRRRK